MADWACNCPPQLQVFTKKSIDLQQILLGHIFRVLATHYRIRRPRVPRESTPNKLRTNSEQTPNELRASSEQTPNKRTSSERTLALFPSQLRAHCGHKYVFEPKYFGGQAVVFAFVFLSKRRQVITGASFNKWPGKVFFEANKHVLRPLVDISSFGHLIFLLCIFLSGWNFFPDKRQTISCSALFCYFACFFC